MIKAKHKPVEEIVQMVAPYKRVLVLGCNTCTAICFIGGEKEVAVLAKTLRLQDKANGGEKVFSEGMTQRQCEWEFLDEAAPSIADADAVLSLACGVGMNAMAEHFSSTPVLPGNDTAFLGLPQELGVFKEKCVACGDCILHITGGLCPIARCAKRLFNGPCGGSVKGICEVSKDVPCIWQMIIDRLQRLGQLSNLDSVWPVRNWRTNDALGPRSFLREDLRVGAMLEKGGRG